MNARSVVATAPPSTLRSTSGGKGSPQLILVVDDSGIVRQLTGAALRAEGYMTIEAEDGTSAASLLEKSRVDLVVLDNDMPGMSGLELLRKLRADHRWATLPVIMLTATPSREIVVEAVKYGVRGYFLKRNFSLPEIMTRVHSVLGSSVRPAPSPAAPASKRPVPISSAPLTPASKPTSSVPVSQSAATPASGAKKVETIPANSNQILAPNLVGRDNTLAAIAEIAGAKTLAGVISDILAMTASEKASISDIAGIVKSDPVLSARVLQLACSAAYGIAKPRSASLDDAVRAIGATAVRDMALTFGVFDSFPPGRSDGMDLFRCWQHAFGVAAVMARIVTKGDAVPAGVPHLIGLCHDLAKIILRQRFPQEYAAIADYARQAEQPVCLMFQSVFGVDRVELNEAMFGKMKLPSPIAGPICEFFKHSEENADAHATLLPRALAIANFFAHALLLAPSTDELVAPVSLTDCRAVLLPTAKINWADIRSESITTTCMLSGLKPEDEAAAYKPLIERSELKIGYARHGSFADLDPLEAGIENLGRIVQLRSPLQAAELDGLSGVVVVSPGFDTSLASEVLRMRAQHGAEIPVLHLFGPGNKNPFSALPAFEELEYPVTMTRLAKFIGKLKPAGKK